MMKPIRKETWMKQKLVESLRNISGLQVSISSISLLTLYIYQGGGAQVTLRQAQSFTCWISMGLLWKSFCWCHFSRKCFMLPRLAKKLRRHRHNAAKCSSGECRGRRWLLTGWCRGSFAGHFDGMSETVELSCCQDPTLQLYMTNHERSVKFHGNPSKSKFIRFHSCHSELHRLLHLAFACWTSQDCSWRVLFSPVKVPGLRPQSSPCLLTYDTNEEYVEECHLACIWSPNLLFLAITWRTPDDSRWQLDSILQNNRNKRKNMKNR